MVTPIVVLIALVCAIAGALIGSRSGHRINGMFFGLLLGPLGVLIVALWKPRRQPLRERGVAGDRTPDAAEDGRVVFTARRTGRGSSLGSLRGG